MNSIPTINFILANNTCCIRRACRASHNNNKNTHRIYYFKIFPITPQLQLYLGITFFIIISHSHNKAFNNK